MTKLIAGTSNKILAESIAKILKLPLTYCDISQFNDKEIGIVMKDDLVDQNVFIIQSTSSPANDRLMELFFIADTARRASAKKITAVILAPTFEWSLLYSSLEEFNNIVIKQDRHYMDTTTLPEISSIPNNLDKIDVCGLNDYWFYSETCLGGM